MSKLTPIEEIEPKKIKIARTKNGSPCLWESYTEFDNLKRGTVIINELGELKPSIFARKSGPKQSLVPIIEGDFVIKVFKDDEGTSISVLKVLKIDNMSNNADLLLNCRILNDETVADKVFEIGINAAKSKLNDPTYIASELLTKTKENE